ncbi:copper transporter [Marinicrinis sediminis]|uniref:Copper transporter n=1 Tax=Marinicrinis sediminis TaxID=1652465 RepID=A0ABW5REJ0_9BACL
MIHTRYHAMTIISIFFALGIGIVIGGTLGQSWMRDTEHFVWREMLTQYEQERVTNAELHDRVEELKALSTQLIPRIKASKVLLLQPAGHPILEENTKRLLEEMGLDILVMEQESGIEAETVNGVESGVETSLETGMEAGPIIERLRAEGVQRPDLIVVYWEGTDDDPQKKSLTMEAWNEGIWGTRADGEETAPTQPRWMFVEPEDWKNAEAEQIGRLLLHMNELLEETTYASDHFADHPGIQ